jgi:RNA polymerase sigma-70 factor (ECF subfamily)
LVRESPERTARIQARDHALIQELITQLLPQLLRAARASGLDPDRAEDVAQATFLTFIEKAPTFDGRAQPRTWLFGILYNKISEARREVRRSQQLEEIDEVVEQRFRPDGRWGRPPKPVDANLIAEEIRRHLEECIEELPTRYRIAFVLREVEQLATAEICNILETKPNNLGVLLYRSRNRLRECLEEKGIRGSHDADL